MQTWRKSSYSQNSGGNCVEVAGNSRTVKLRDTQHRHLGHLQVPAAEWRAFLAGLRRDDMQPTERRES